MKALCMITVKPGMVDKVVQILRKKRKTTNNLTFKSHKIYVIIDFSESRTSMIDLRNYHSMQKRFGDFNLNQLF